MCGHPTFGGFGCQQPDSSIVKFSINISNGLMTESIDDGGLNQLFH